MWQQKYERQKKYYYANKEKVNKYYKENRERLLEKDKNYRLDNAEKIKKYLKEYNKKRYNYIKKGISIDERKKMSERIKGLNNPRWKGGITSTNQQIRGSDKYKQWRKTVYKRDNYTCWICEGKDKLCAHHFKKFSDYPKLRFTVFNGLTLCRFCHKTYTSFK